jgi:peptidyl-prolyl cis-trans isomerase C
MGCSNHAELASEPRARVSVNGVVIPHDAIARETQNHPAPSPLAAWQAAARALVIRELLLQEANRLGIDAAPEVDDESRQETAEEAKIRALFAQEVRTPEPDEDSCRRYYLQNRAKFRSPDIYEAAHILVAARQSDSIAYAQARETAQTLLSLLKIKPSLFAELAREHSDCPSAGTGGNLGQITSGQATPEFDNALASMQPGMMGVEPIETRYGFHIIRLDQRIPGEELPFDVVRNDIASQLTGRVQWIAASQYVARLAARATIEGVVLPDPASLQTN